MRRRVADFSVSPLDEPLHVGCVGVAAVVLAPGELAEFGDQALGLAEELDRSGVLEFQAGYFFYPSHEAPTLG